MKSLYESIISNTRIGRTAKFADDIDYQREVLLRLLVDKFNISATVNRDIFECNDNKIDANKKIRQIETELKKFNYFISSNVSERDNGKIILLKLEPPITKENLFPEVGIELRCKTSVIEISIFDSRDWMFDWKKLFKKL